MSPLTSSPAWLALKSHRENFAGTRLTELFAGDPERFFTEPHYNGFPAVLVRLPKVTRTQLHKLIVDAWLCQAPRELVKEDAMLIRRRGSRASGCGILL